MKFLRLLASFVALALIAGLPVVSAHAATADCATVSATADGGCCGGADMASCSMACTVPAAAVGKVFDRAAQLVSGTRPERYSAPTRSVSRPPDTAPPKLLSA